jgi:His Kinase A (phosphoacceptor) domain.
MALLHGRRLRRMRRRAEARIDAAREERDAAEEALDTATNRVETLDEMRTAKSQFLEEISHAFRRPLTLTLGPIDTLLDGRYGALGDEVRTQLRLAERSGRASCGS